MSKVICPGSFNPVTKGHIDIFERCAHLFDSVIVLVVSNRDKRYGATAEQRVDWIRRATAHVANISADSYGGLLADYVRIVSADFIVKGVRNDLDLIGESQMYYANRTLMPEGVDTLLMPTREQYIYLSSSLVRDIAAHGGSIDEFVPQCIVREVAQTYRTQTESGGSRT